MDIKKCTTSNVFNAMPDAPAMPIVPSTVTSKGIGRIDKEDTRKASTLSKRPARPTARTGSSNRQKGQEPAADYKSGDNEEFEVAMFTPTHTIYLLAHISSQRTYVGQTMYTAELRFEGHCRPDSGCRKLRDTIQKDGPGSFTVKTLEDGILNQGLANEREIALIKEHNSRSDPDCYEKSGFNLTDGGGGTRDDSWWFFMHSKLVAFCEKHKRMPSSKRDNNAYVDDELKLLRWMSNQKTIGKKNMPSNRIPMLEGKHGAFYEWSWDPLFDKWKV